MRIREGIRPEDFERDPPDAGDGGETSVQAEAHADRKKRLREVERSKRRLGEVEQLIPKAEAAVARLDAALIEAATDHQRAMALAREREAAQQAVDELYAEWESLERSIAD